MPCKIDFPVLKFVALRLWLSQGHQLISLALTFLDVLVEAIILCDGLDVGEAAAIDVAEKQLISRQVAWHEHVLRVLGGVQRGVDAADFVAVGPGADAVELGRRQREEARKGCRGNGTGNSKGLIL